MRRAQDLLRRERQLAARYGLGKALLLCDYYTGIVAMLDSATGEASEYFLDVVERARAHPRLAARSALFGLWIVGLDNSTRHLPIILEAYQDADFLDAWYFRVAARRGLASLGLAHVNIVDEGMHSEIDRLLQAVHACLSVRPGPTSPTPRIVTQPGVARLRGAPAQFAREGESILPTVTPEVRMSSADQRRSIANRSVGWFAATLSCTVVAILISVLGDAWSRSSGADGLNALADGVVSSLLVLSSSVSLALLFTGVVGRAVRGRTEPKP